MTTEAQRPAVQQSADWKNTILAGLANYIDAGSIVAGAAALAGVFLLYTRPAFMVTMIDQLWACF